MDAVRIIAALRAQKLLLGFISRERVQHAGESGTSSRTDLTNAIAQPAAGSVDYSSHRTSGQRPRSPLRAQRSALEKPRDPGMFSIHIFLGDQLTDEVITVIGRHSAAVVHESCMAGS
jgi:hypothetical protein